MAAAVPPPVWAVLAEAVERTAHKMKPQHVANTFNALSKLFIRSVQLGLLLKHARYADIFGCDVWERQR